MNFELLIKTIETNPSSIKSISFSSPVKLRKTQDQIEVVNGVEKKVRVPNPHFDNVMKVVEGMEVIVGVNYQDMINQKLSTEGKSEDFVSNPRKWGERLGNSCVITHKGNTYLEVIVKSSGKVGYEYNGEQITKNSVIGLQKSYGPNSENQGGLEEKVEVRTIKLNNITGFEVR